ncbi:hypothetical protein [Streptomyces sp. MJP52]|uniref:hypothetical protein n=1 Tax=Streptomyces sp. MJP52 TaxID=2940555 RepID=UPI00247463A3|nr:hypothetical protein [Streptomyces sp. MJP52]MDH6226803.1 hypothetical protein [Streptomyces sp. MJP52]
MAAEFFGDDHALRSTVLYVDPEVEQDLMEYYEIETTLTEAVSDELNWAYPDRSLFSTVRSECRVWAERGAPGLPPSLPLLGLSVMAASQMASSDGMLKSNFYGRWVQLFGEHPSTSRAKRLEHDFKDVAEMWKDLDSWLGQTGGLCGISTISTGFPYWKIGYPISQALVRGSDRQVLTRFFAATRLRPQNANEVSGRELLRRLRVWTAGRDRHLSDRLLQELAMAPDTGDSLVTELLKRLADDWDGTLHEPERLHRRRALALRLMVTDRGRSMEWLAEADGCPDAVRVAYNGTGRDFHLHKAYGEVYEGLESLAPSVQQLAGGFRLEGNEVVFEWIPVDVVLLRMHPQLGEWVSTEYFEPGEQHWILAADSAASEVRTMVNALGGRTVRETTAAVPGWKLFKGVRAVSSAAFTKTLDRGGEHAQVLEPQLRSKVELAGGLRIASEYRAGGAGVGHYLRGGAPDLLLPASDSADGLVEVFLDGVSERLPRDPRMPFPLWLVPLEEGEHRVGTADSTQVFTVFDGLNEGLPDGTGKLGYRCEATVNLQISAVEEAEAAIRGAQLPEGTSRAPHIELVRQEVLEAYLLHHRGSVREVPPSPVPEWMKKEKGPGKKPRLPEQMRGPCLEVAVPEGYVWLVYRTASRWTVRPVASMAEIPEPVVTGHDELWARVVLSAKDRPAPFPWGAYVEAAERAVGSGDGA